MAGMKTVLVVLCVTLLMSFSGALAQSYEDFKASAEQGDAKARYELGICYLKGRCGVEENIHQARYWLALSANQDYAPAQSQLGSLLLYGLDLPREPKKAVQYLQKAAEQNDPLGQYKLGVAYQYGLGIEKDIDKAIGWYLKAAEQQYKDAMYNLAWIYGCKNEGKLNHSEAFDWYEKAANTGDPYSQAYLASRYSQGLGVEQNYELAIEWYKKAVRQGLDVAYYGLGLSYFYGEGVEQDYGKALELFFKAAEQGHTKAIGVAGHMYYKGRGIPANKEKSIELLNRAAEAGDSHSQVKLGHIYRDSGDPEKARFLYTQAALNGHLYAQYNRLLAAMEEKNAPEGYKWAYLASINPERVDSPFDEQTQEAMNEYIQFVLEKMKELLSEEEIRSIELEAQKIQDKYLSEQTCQR